MLIQMLKNAFKPEEGRTRTILNKGTIVEVTNEQAKVLVEKGVAAEVKKTVKAEPTEPAAEVEPSTKKSSRSKPE